jgi:hypothetical protein
MPTPEITALLDRARVAEEQGRWNAALEALRKAEQRMPAQAIADRVAVLLRVAAIGRDRLGLDAMVIETLDKVLAIDPENRMGLEQRAQVRARTGR